MFHRQLSTISGIILAVSLTVSWSTPGCCSSRTQAAPATFDWRSFNPLTAPEPDRLVPNPRYMQGPNYVYHQGVAFPSDPTKSNIVFGRGKDKIPTEIYAPAYSPILVGGKVVISPKAGESLSVKVGADTTEIWGTTWYTPLPDISYAANPTNITPFDPRLTFYWDRSGWPSVIYGNPEGKISVSGKSGEFPNSNRPTYLDVVDSQKQTHRILLMALPGNAIQHNSNIQNPTVSNTKRTNPDESAAPHAQTLKSDNEAQKLTKQESKLDRQQALAEALDEQRLAQKRARELRPESAAQATEPKRQDEKHDAEVAENADSTTSVETKIITAKEHLREITSLNSNANELLFGTATKAGVLSALKQDVGTLYSASGNKLASNITIAFTLAGQPPSGKAGVTPSLLRDFLHASIDELKPLKSSGDDWAKAVADAHKLVDEQFYRTSAENIRNSIYSKSDINPVEAMASLLEGAIKSGHWDTLARGQNSPLWDIYALAANQPAHKDQAIAFLDRFKETYPEYAKDAARIKDLLLNPPPPSVRTEKPSQSSLSVGLGTSSAPPASAPSAQSTSKPVTSDGKVEYAPGIFQRGAWSQNLTMTPRGWQDAAGNIYTQTSGGYLQLIAGPDFATVQPAPATNKVATSVTAPSPKPVTSNSSPTQQASTNQLEAVLKLDFSSPATPIQQTAKGYGLTANVVTDMWGSKTDYYSTKDGARVKPENVADYIRAQQNLTKVAGSVGGEQWLITQFGLKAQMTTDMWGTTQTGYSAPGEGSTNGPAGLSLAAISQPMSSMKPSNINKDSGSKPLPTLDPATAQVMEAYLKSIGKNSQPTYNAFGESGSNIDFFKAITTPPQQQAVEKWFAADGSGGIRPDQILTAAQLQTLYRTSTSEQQAMLKKHSPLKVQNLYSDDWSMAVHESVPTSGFSTSSGLTSLSIGTGSINQTQVSGVSGAIVTRAGSGYATTVFQEANGAKHSGDIKQFGSDNKNADWENTEGKAADLSLTRKMTPTWTDSNGITYNLVDSGTQGVSKYVDSEGKTHLVDYWSNQEIESPASSQPAQASPAAGAYVTVEKPLPITGNAGKHFGTPEQALMDWGQQVIDRTTTENIEYAARLYKNQDGTWSYTPSLPGDDHSSNPNSTQLKDFIAKNHGSETSYDLHSHGSDKDPTYGKQSYTPSRTDMSKSDFSGEPQFILVPDGTIKMYNPNDGTGAGYFIPNTVDNLSKVVNKDLGNFHAVPTIIGNVKVQKGWIQTGLR